MLRPRRVEIAVLSVLLLALVLLATLIVRGGGARAHDLAATGTPVTAAELGEPAAPAAPAVRKDAGPSRGIDRDWVARTSRAAGIPAPAIRAYAAAQVRLAAEQPGCHLSWNTLAGIGWVESQHGTIGGRSLGDDGHSTTPVIGPALDGDGFAAIRATPTSTAWHGDPTWEHAVGPLQFISSSWQRWGADADGDGVADPRDLDDAALATGRYLCADRHDLATGSGWNAAVYSYNHDQSYVRQVLAAANTYAQRSRG